MSTLSISLTREEHYALTALLRTAVSAGALSVLGLRDLHDRMAMPYRREIQERVPDVHGTTMAAVLPGFCKTQSPVHLAPQSWESVFEGRNAVDWYTWSGSSDSLVVRLAGLLQDARDGLENLGEDLSDEEQELLTEQLAEIDALLAEVQS